MAIFTPSRSRQPKPSSAGSTLFGILDAASFAIVAVTPEGRLAYGNETAEMMLGYDHYELTNRDLTDVVNADSAWIRTQLSSLAQGDPWSGNVSMRRRQGDSVAFAVNAFATQGLEGSPAYIGLLHTEIDPRARSQRLDTDFSAFALSTRETCAVLLMSEGFADKEIAALLGTTVWTVNKDVGVILRKMNARSRTEACIKAIKSNLLL